MAKQKPTVVVTRKLPDIVETRMMELFDVRLNLTDEPLAPERLIEGGALGRCAGADGNRPNHRGRPQQRRQ